MKLPKNQFTELKTIKKETLEVDSSNKASMLVPDLNNAIAKTNFIKNVEKMVRGSLEYRKYIGFLKTNLNLTKCRFLENVDVSKLKKTHIEMHHYPFTLYDIVEIVTDKVDAEGGILNELVVAEEVMKLHFENKIGLVPLTITVHQLVHEGQLFVPSTFIHGEYKKFMKEYDEYIIDLHRNYVQSIEANTRRMMEGTLKFNTDILNGKTIEINDAQRDYDKELYILDGLDEDQIV